MKLLNPIIEKLQEAFPPNRVALLLAGTITAVSGSIAAWLAAHFPGLNFGSVEIAGILGAAVIVTVRLLDRWFEQWQKGEPVAYDADIEQALAELGDSPDVQSFFAAHGTMEAVGFALNELRARVAVGTLDDSKIADELAAIADVAVQFLQEHPLEQQPQPAVAAPPVASPE